MDPITTGIALALGQGLAQVGGKLAETATGALLAPAEELLKSWAQKPYRKKESDRRLQAIFLSALQDAGGIIGDGDVYFVCFIQA